MVYWSLSFALEAFWKVWGSLVSSLLKGVDWPLWVRVWVLGEESLLLWPASLEGLWQELFFGGPPDLRICGASLRVEFPQGEALTSFLEDSMLAGNSSVGLHSSVSKNLPSGPSLHYSSLSSAHSRVRSTFDLQPPENISVLFPRNQSSFQITWVRENIHAFSCFLKCN